MEKKIVTLFRGGIKQVDLPIKEVMIPDLWHVVEAMRGGKNNKEMRKQIIECWHICGALKAHIQEIKRI